nr:uncharacterized protein LOC111420041 [Onthophagus taurus]XP_022909385.1 uncharacterized protein LOC111420600 [Onthophagus taurus]
MTIGTDQQEVRDAIQKKIGNITETEFSISSMRPYAESMLAVTVQLSREGTERLLNEKRIRMGLAMCQVEERREIKRCNRCWSPQHLARNCKGEDRSSKCYNCGQEGHKNKNCTNPMKCLDCGSEEHRAGSNRCKKFREMLKYNKQSEEKERQKETHKKENMTQEVDMENSTDINPMEEREGNMDMTKISNPDGEKEEKKTQTMTDKTTRKNMEKKENAKVGTNDERELIEAQKAEWTKQQPRKVKKSEEKGLKETSKSQHLSK